MKKTTLYLPDDLKRTLERVARARSCSEADVVREAIGRLAREERIRPQLPLFESGQPDLAEHTEELLAGFGER
jgi:hypothetical protein